MKILVIRHDVYGDVLVVSSVFRGLKEKYPGCITHYWCNPGYDAVVENNPYIDGIVHGNDGTYDLVLPIDHSNQWNDWMPKVHCRIASVPYHPQEVWFTPTELTWAEQYVGCVAVATTAGWPGRRYKHWLEALKPLKDRFRFVQVDLGGDVYKGIEHPRLTVRQAMAVVNVAALYVGVDSLMMHVAAACCTPMVVVMGATGAEIQYLPCSSIVRPYEYAGWGDEAGVYREGIEVAPEVVTGEILKKIGVPIIVQHTDCDGNIL